jgi:methyl-accepting chemotaxis protein
MCRPQTIFLKGHNFHRRPKRLAFYEYPSTDSENLHVRGHMKIMQNFKIGRRLAFSLGFLIALLGINSTIGIILLDDLTHHLNTVVSIEQEKSQLSSEWLHIIVLNSLRSRTALLGPPELVPEMQREIESSSAELNRISQRINKILNSQEDIALLEIIEKNRGANRKARTALAERRALGEDVRAEFSTQITPLTDVYVGNIRQLQQAQKERYDAALVRANQNAERGRFVLIASSSVAVLLGAFLAFALSRSITSPLRESVGSTKRIAAGDLSEPIAIRGADETSELMGGLSLMQKSLISIVMGVRTSAESIAVASGQIAQGNDDLSARTEHQASTLQQTAASMETLIATVRQTAENAQLANERAQEASVVAVQGGEVVNEVVETMNDINETSRRISDIIGTIDGIAFQTNILALNAAVEAARAGELGRGFAVVAGEVRSLAQRSAEAAKEVRQLIGASVDRAREGAIRANRASAKTTEVLVTIQGLVAIMGEISSACQEQSLGVGQVGHAVSTMDEVTQQNAALVEQSAAAASSLSCQAREMVAAVSVFKLPAVPNA